MIYIYIYIQDALWEALWWGRWGLSNNAGHHGWPTTKKLKKNHWLERPKTVPLKDEISAKINNSKFYIWNSFFENIFWAYNFFIFVHTFQWTSSEFFFISDFLIESLKANKNQRKRSLIVQYNFTQKTSPILRTPTHLILKAICSHNAAKNL